MPCPWLAAGSTHEDLSIFPCGTMFCCSGAAWLFPALFQVSTHLLPWVYPCMVSAQAYLHGHFPGGFCAVKQPQEAEPRIWSRFQFWDSL